MELKEFIKIVLTDIVGAVSEAREEISDPTTIIAPQPRSGNEHHETTLPNGRIMRVHDIDFEVVLTKSAKSDIGVGVFLGDVGGGFRRRGENTSLSKIRFTIPITYPLHAEK